MDAMEAMGRRHLMDLVMMAVAWRCGSSACGRRRLRLWRWPCWRGLGLVVEASEAGAVGRHGMPCGAMALGLFEGKAALVSAGGECATGPSQARVDGHVRHSPMSYGPFTSSLQVPHSFERAFSSRRHPSRSSAGTSASAMSGGGRCATMAWIPSPSSRMQYPCQGSP